MPADLEAEVVGDQPGRTQVVVMQVEVARVCRRFQREHQRPALYVPLSASPRALFVSSSSRTTTSARMNRMSHFAGNRRRLSLLGVARPLSLSAPNPRFKGKLKPATVDRD